MIHNLCIGIHLVTPSQTPSPLPKKPSNSTKKPSNPTYNWCLLVRLCSTHL